jgi:hypothetical protein
MRRNNTGKNYLAIRNLYQLTSNLTGRDFPSPMTRRCHSAACTVTGIYVACLQICDLSGNQTALAATAANEVNHLQPVPSIQNGLRPTRPRNDLSIVLNRDPVTLQPKLPNELFEACRLWERLKCAGLAVKNQSECHNISSLAGELITPHQRIITWTPSRYSNSRTARSVTHHSNRRFIVWHLA